ncbi:MAG: hypothetical protein LUE17_04775 [Planctomycetaceae bacterium]|nr:hypothetical protein [Planctomycetaceae bacterium]
MKKAYSTAKVINLAGAMIAYLIGSGFASGQESLQFFTAYGTWGCLGAGICAGVIYFFFSTTIMEDGRKLQLTQSNDIFRYYCGRYLGTFYEWYTPFFSFPGFCRDDLGAGAILNEYYGLHPLVGRAMMAGLSLAVVLLGLNRMIDIIGKIGPIIIIFGIIVGLANIFLSSDGFATADQTLAAIEVNRAAPTWYLSGVIFAAFGCILAAPFLARIGATTSSSTEARFGGGLGAVTFIIACMVMAYGLLASIGDIHSKNVPALILADKMFPAVGVLFSLILFGAVFSTAVPMLWLTCNRISTDEKSGKFRASTLILTLIAFFGGQLPFATLVNTIYPFTGYLGILLIVCIGVRCLRSAVRLSKTAEDGTMNLERQR